ncbi:unnamed protein product, partial [Iphiclides podalirius]
MSTLRKIARPTSSAVCFPHFREPNEAQRDLSIYATKMAAIKLSRIRAAVEMSPAVSNPSNTNRRAIRIT